MKCNFCGHEQSENAIFCSECGRDLRNNHTFYNASQQVTPEQRVQDDEANKIIQNTQDGRQSPFPGQVYPPPQGYIPPTGYIPPHNYYYRQTAPNSGKGMASLVLGLLSLFIGFIGLILGIAAIIVGSSALKEQRELGGSTGNAKAGIATGVAGTVLWSIIIIFYAVLIASLTY